MVGLSYYLGHSLQVKEIKFVKDLQERQQIVFKVIPLLLSLISMMVFFGVFFFFLRGHIRVVIYVGVSDGYIEIFPP